MAALHWRTLIDRYLEEDLGPGDVTSRTLIRPGEAGAAAVVARQPALVAGIAYAAAVFAARGVSTRACVADGERVAAGEVLLRVWGPATGILEAERTALNLLARMSGIAGATKRLGDRLKEAGSTALVAATRKTTPGFRFFEKEAVRIAGGDPYRQGLWDVAMVKDNHREAVGGVAAAVALLRQEHPALQVVAEVESLEDAQAAAAAGAHWVLVDNQPPEVGRSWADTLRREHPDVRIEASGGIRPEDVEAYGWADRISLGWLTQATPAADLALDWVPDAGAASQEEDA